ncbi:protein FAM227A-like isoform X3 [Mytilus galloprovincialis]|uniref:protein FAM227A-like isoform X3 n=1 Tax=Mytilus galloprovincialis TaxID=29158 RepID=UPI003F7C29F9
MERLNRVGSPIDICDGNLDSKPEVLAKKRKQIESIQRAKSPFFIGSIDLVNKRISKLERRFQKYTQLVVESRASQHEDISDTASVISGKGMDRYQTKEKEAKEINKFAGYFTMKQTFLPGRSERVKNIAKVSMSQGKVNTVKKDTGKPKFVELYQYPGYDGIELTPLPDDIPAIEMLKKATEAQMELYKKGVSQPVYKPYYEKWFYCEASQAVFQDLFWYLFLDKYQSSKNSQVRLFNRCAHNFVKLMMYVNHPRFRDVFFTDYASLISQAIYAAYCHSFPDSYRQFGEQFKEDIITLVYDWITGIKPAPRLWMKWNMSKLEPPDINIREEMINSQKKKSSSNINSSFLDNLLSTNSPSQYTSTTSLNQSMSMASGFGGKRRRGIHRKRSSIASTSSKIKNSGSASSSRDGSTVDFSSDSMKSSPGKHKPKQRPVDPRKLMDALTPIRETTLEDMYEKHDTKTSTSHSAVKVPSKMSERMVQESHPACVGPTFSRCSFNINGQSPLLSHYMYMKHLQYDSGQNVRVTRTEMENLPPLDTPTYREVIKESFKNVRNMQRQYEVFYEKSSKENRASLKKHRLLKKEYELKESALLADPKQVKKLVELILLDLDTDDENTTSGADEALELAMKSVQVA